MSEPISQSAIQVRAYQLWEESGRVDGNHDEHWRRAEAECGAAAEAGAGAMDAPTVPSGMDESSDGAAARSGIDGETSRPPGRAKSKPRRWPTPIADV